MKVLMIYPEFPDTFWSFKHARSFVGKKASFPPLGLLTVAAMFPEDWDVKLIDMNVRSLSGRDLAWADWAFISGMGVQKRSARSVIARCKNAGLKVVAGGPLFTMEHELFEEVDHFILNEAELTLPHPHMHERAFVLVPLLDLAPGFHIPGLGPAAAQLARLTAEERSSVTAVSPEQRSL